MDREEFIKKQLQKFGCFHEGNMAIWKNDYELVLQEPDIDYKMLDFKIIKFWDNTFNAPSTKWISEAKQDCIPKDERCQVLKDIEQMKNNTAPPPPDVLARIEAMRKKVRAI